MRKISTKIFIAILTSSILVATVVGVLILIETSRVIVTETTDKIECLTKSYAYQFDQRFRNVDTSLRNLQAYVVSTFDAARFGRNRRYLYQYKAMMTPLIKNTLAATPGVINAYFYFDPNLIGEPNDIWFTRQTPDGSLRRMPEIKDKYYFNLNNPQATWFYQAVREGKTITTNPYHDPFANQMMLISCTRPIYQDGRLIGVAGFDFRFDDIYRSVQNIKPYQTGYAFLMNDQLHWIIHPKLSKGLTSNLLEPQLYPQLTKTLATNDSGIMNYRAESGVARVTAFAKLSNGWVLGITAPLQDAYQRVAAIRTIILVALGIGVLLALGAALLVGRLISQPFNRLVEYINSVASGNLDIEIPFRYHDEVGVVYDQFRHMVTSLQTARNEITSSNQDLLVKNAELERFTYTVSHDLKSPLITIKSFAGLIAKEIAQGRYDRVHSDLQRVGNAADKMAELLEGLLELSRIGRMANPAETIAMSRLAQEVRELLFEIIQAKQVQVRIQEDLPPVTGDRNRIREVWQNLLENAVKFMDKENGTIEIGCFVQPTGPVYFVRDNGPGIPAQYHEKIFGLFDKLDNRADGSGIGLALVKRIIEYHHGRIWLESEPGVGTTFFFTVAE